MKHSKKQLISVTINRHIANRVDSFIDREFNAWKTDYREYTQSCIDPSKVDSTNNLLAEYIRYIYSQYSIKDPLKEPIITINGKICSPVKPAKNISYTKPYIKKSLQSRFIKQKVFHHSQPHQPKSKQSITLKSRQSQQSMITPRKRLSYTMKSDIDDGTHKKSYISREMPMTPKFDVLSNKKQTLFSGFHSHRSTQINNSSLGSNRISISLNQEIQQVYRYCLGCEKKVLEANIEPHQRNCRQLQQFYEMNLDKMLEKIQEKIEEIRTKVQTNTESLEEEDAQLLKTVNKILSNESKQISQTGVITQQFQSGYKDSKKVSQKWVAAFDQVYKLRWFIKVRELIYNKFQK